MMNLALITVFTALAILLCAGFLHLLPRLGGFGRRISESMCRAPMLDVLITYFGIAPLAVGPIVGGWIGLAGGIFGQISAVLIWSLLHSAANPRVRRGPRIHRTLNQIVGPWRNYTALWLTALMVPMFWTVRMIEIFLYPLIRGLVRFPKYDQGTWVCVSRQKFDGLISHDLIWCLYCDWMTGVWSLGSEILRNVESFWCPIRFSSHEKCANCQVDFPDVAGAWVSADGTMTQVTEVLNRKYDGTTDGANSWFGHPTRLTGNGDPSTKREC